MCSLRKFDAEFSGLLPVPMLDASYPVTGTLPWPTSHALSISDILAQLMSTDSAIGAWRVSVSGTKLTIGEMISIVYPLTGSLCRIAGFLDLWKASVSSVIVSIAHDVTRPISESLTRLGLFMVLLTGYARDEIVGRVRLRNRLLLNPEELI